MVSLLERQTDVLDRIRIENIPHGTEFPLRLIKKFLPPYYSGHIQGILNLGCGVVNDVWRFRNAGYGMMGLDLNTEAVKASKNFGITALRRDVTKMGYMYEKPETGEEHVINSMWGMEFWDSVLAEGLLCNLTSEQLTDLFINVDWYLRGGGKFFIADILRPDQDIDYLRYRLGKDSARELISKWKRRYSENEQLGLPYGTFTVAKPGMHKTKEWGSGRTLRDLSRSPDFERCARHNTLKEIRQLARNSDFEELLYKPTIFYSRTGEPLLGGLFAFHKPVYVFNPSKYGWTYEQELEDKARYWASPRGQKLHHEIFGEYIKKQKKRESSE